MNLRRLVLLGLMGSFIGFVGCDPNVAPRVRNEAEVNINVESTGDAIASVFVSPRSMARLRHLGAELAATDPFRSGRGATFRINGNDGGSPFLDVTWAGVFRPGRRPTFSFDSGPLWLALSKRSLTKVPLSLSPPVVPRTMNAKPPPIDRDYDYPAWELSPARPRVIVSVLLHPSPLRFLWSFTWTVLALAGLLLSGLTLLRRGLRGSVVGAVGATVAVTGGVINIIGAAGVQADNLGAAGWVSGWPFTVWFFAVLADVLAPFAGVALLGVSLIPLLTRRQAPSS